MCVKQPDFKSSHDFKTPVVRVSLHICKATASRCLTFLLNKCLSCFWLHLCLSANWLIDLLFQQCILGRSSAETFLLWSLY